jgi:hypothetical protein
MGGNCVEIQLRLEFRQGDDGRSFGETSEQDEHLTEDVEEWEKRNECLSVGRQIQRIARPAGKGRGARLGDVMHSTSCVAFAWKHKGHAELFIWSKTFP